MNLGGDDQARGDLQAFLERTDDPHAQAQAKALPQKLNMP